MFLAGLVSGLVGECVGGGQEVPFTEVQMTDLPGGWGVMGWWGGNQGPCRQVASSNCPSGQKTCPGPRVQVFSYVLSS